MTTDLIWWQAMAASTSQWVQGVNWQDEVSLLAWLTAEDNCIQPCLRTASMTRAASYRTTALHTTENHLRQQTAESPGTPPQPTHTSLHQTLGRRSDERWVPTRQTPAEGTSCAAAAHTRRGPERPLSAAQLYRCLDDGAEASLSDMWVLTEAVLGYECRPVDTAPAAVGHTGGTAVAEWMGLVWRTRAWQTAGKRLAVTVALVAWWSTAERNHST